MKCSLLLVVLLAYNVTGSLTEDRKRSTQPSYSVAELCKLYNLGSLPGHYRVSPSDESVPIATYLDDVGYRSGIPTLPGTPGMGSGLMRGPYQPNVFGSQPPYLPIYPGVMPSVGFNSAVESSSLFEPQAPVIVPAIYQQRLPVVPQIVPAVPVSTSFLPTPTNYNFNPFPMSVPPIGTVSPYSYPTEFNSFPGGYKMMYQPSYSNLVGMGQQSPTKSFQVIQAIPGQPMMNIPHDPPAKSSPKEGSGLGATVGQPHWNSLFSDSIMEKLAPFLTQPRNGVSHNTFENQPTTMSNCIPISSLRFPPRCPPGFKLGNSNCMCAPDLDASSSGFNNLAAERKLR